MLQRKLKCNERMEKVQGKEGCGSSCQGSKVKPVCREYGWMLLEHYRPYLFMPGLPW